MRWSGFVKKPDLDLEDAGVLAVYLREVVNFDLVSWKGGAELLQFL
jgi:hypothetical protein